MKYGLSESQLQEIIAFISQYPEIEEAVLFGSRAIDTFKEASDIDIALKGEFVNHGLAAKLKYNIEEDTYLPFFFDFVAYPTITNEDLKKHIDTKGVLIYRKGGPGISEWKEYCLGDLAEKIAMGPFGSNIKVETFKDSGIPIISGMHLHGIRLIDNNFNYITKEHADKLISSNVYRHDVIFTHAGTIGQVSYIPDTSRFKRYIISQRQFYLRCNPKKLDYKYITYFFKSPLGQHLIDANTNQTGVPSIAQPVTFLKNAEVPIPPLAEQRAIAAVLSSLDDKIDLLHRQNKTLEAMAEALFRQWFVEEADEGWKEGTVADLIDFNPNRKLPKGTPAPYLGMASLSISTFMPTDWCEREFSSGMKFMNGDTLIARITPCLENGKTAFITFLKENETGWGSTEYIIMRPKEPLHPFFAYTLARTKDFRDYAEGCLEGTSGRQRVNIDHLMIYPISLPDKQTIENFNSLARSIVPKLSQNAQQIRTLEKLRDTLLPKLMSGKVRVSV